MTPSIFQRPRIIGSRGWHLRISFALGDLALHLTRRHSPYRCPHRAVRTLRLCAPEQELDSRTRRQTDLPRLVPMKCVLHLEVTFTLHDAQVKGFAGLVRAVHIGLNI
jgi:hypothetical protein